ncbi:MAG: acyl-CoA reductase [Cytophagaceae bacterium]|nr:acyl-CoA reductase [Cytophagaceae bacterium]
MDLMTRLNAFSQLGEWLRSPEAHDQRTQWASAARHENNWFTPQNVSLALDTIAQQYLVRTNLEAWIASYSFAADAKLTEPKQVGVIMAGNIPAVGFHDALCVLIAGHRLLAKLSSQDSALMRALLQKLVEIETGFADDVVFAERLNDADATIATGNDNSARYFEYYFGKKPHIIRKNRTAVGVLTGLEPTEELSALGGDILTYFGLGCRNVSKLYVPEEYDFQDFYESIEPSGDVILHHKYHNNYDYNKAVLLINQTPFLDNGFLLLTPNNATVSPLSVVHFERYASTDQLKEDLTENAEKIQCVVSAGGWLPGSLPFGTAQTPRLKDYADGVDTMAFLQSMSE